MRDLSFILLFLALSAVVHGVDENPPLGFCPARYREMLARVARLHSSNLAAPNYDLGRKAATLQRDPLRADETAILERAGLTLFPSKESFKTESPAAQFEEWAKDLDAFLITHRNDPQVRSAVQRFIVDFTNNPRDGVLPGDAAWSEPRHIPDWRDFYRLPRYYDLQGNRLALAETNRPITEMPARIAGADLAAAPLMSVQVFGNLRNGMGFLDLIKDGSMSGADKVTPQIAALRRTHLAIRLLEEGERYLKQERP